MYLYLPNLPIRKEIPYWKFSQKKRNPFIISVTLTYFGWYICCRIDLCRAEPLNSQVRKVKLHSSAQWSFASPKIHFICCQSFESIFWKLRYYFLIWNVFFCLKSCIGCDFRPLKFDKKYFARVKAIKFCKYLKIHKIFQLQSIQEHDHSICVLKPF